MSDQAESLTGDQLLAKLREPLPVEQGESRPGFTAYANRLDDLFGASGWDQNAHATAEGVRCEITLRHEGFTLVQRSAISRNTERAFILCCHLIGVGRSQG